MSKGNPVVGCRLPREMYEKIKQLVDRSAYTCFGEPPTVAKWMVQAAKEKLAQIRRRDEHAARKRARRKAAPADPQITVADPGANV